MANEFKSCGKRFQALHRTIIALLFTNCCLLAQAKAQSDTSVQFTLRSIADGILRDATFKFVDVQNSRQYVSPSDAPHGAGLRIKSSYNDWRYWNGVLNLAMMKVGADLHSPSYTNYVSRDIQFCFENARFFEERHKKEGKWEYPLGQMFTMEELDDCGAMGASVIEVYRHNPQERYKAYIDRAADHILRRQPRLEDGSLVRSFPRKWTLWADDLYMSISFLARMGELIGDKRYFDDAANQVINFNKHLFNREVGLFYHCWFSDSGKTGVAFWGRANGWTLMAQVDLLDRLPKKDVNFDTLLSLFRRQTSRLIRYQGSDGMWHQLLDKPDSYSETSSTAMITYAIAWGVNKGYLGHEYAPTAKRGWSGIFRMIHPDGKIDGICAGTGVGENLDFYYKRPKPLNDPHGIGAVLLAGTEILKLPD